MSNCLQWYADNSELKGLNKAEIPTILIIGGIIISKENQPSLKNRIEQVKAKYGHSRAPIKWNFKDLKKIYEKRDMPELYDAMLKSSKEWRNEIFKSLSEYDFSVILSVIESYSPDRGVINKNKEDLSQYVFSNSLMRFGLHVAEFKPSKAEVILDWPDKGNAKPFDEEYASAYCNGITHSKSTKYKSGPLRTIGFNDHLLYANMNHSTLLQLSDLIVGSTKDFIECTLEEKESSFGTDCLRRIKHKFRGYPNNVFGRGISISTGNEDLHSRLRTSINRFFC